MIPVKLTTLTPVHIGSGREFTRDVEFLNMKDSVGIIDEKKILSLIGEENIPIWVSMIENKKPLLEYLLKRDPNLKLKQVCSRTMPLFSKDFSRVKTLKEQLIDGMDHPIIPGSSIKGAIRTAIFNLLQNQSGKFWTEDKITTRNGRISDKQIQSFYFGSDPNHDIMRFLKIGDALFQKDVLIALSVLSMNYLFERTKRDDKFLQLTEAIASEEKASLRLKIDLNLWEKNIENNEIKGPVPEFLSSYQSLFGAINNFTRKLIEKEIEFWLEDQDKQVVEDYRNELGRLLKIINSCSENETVLRLGHGSGWLFMTGGWVKNEKYIGDDLYDKIMYKTRPNNERYRDYFFPKTRRMDEDGELLGFVKLSIEN